MNKDDIIRQLKIVTPEQVTSIKRIIDLCNHAERLHEIQQTGFLSPDLMTYIPRILMFYRDLDYKLAGGYPYAEYRRLTIYPDYHVDVADGISIVDLTYNTKYGAIGHRDVLGAVLGLGIKREVVGDILVAPGHVQLMAADDIAGYITEQLVKIGRVTVSASLVGPEHLMAYEPEYKLVDVTVKSLRLDAVIARGFNISRSKAATLIKSEVVKLNHNICSQVSKEIDEDTLISVRGYGRMRVEGFHGLTRKERHKITIKRYI